MNILYESYPFIEGCLKFGVCYVKREIKICIYFVLERCATKFFYVY